MTGSRRRYVWGTGMKYSLNKGYGDEKLIEADQYDYQNNGMFVTFWKETPSGHLAVYTVKASAVIKIEAVEETS